MRTRIFLIAMFVLSLVPIGGISLVAQQSATGAAPSRPQGPCDIYAAAGDPCVAAHSTTRALYASYSGPLYQVLRQSDGKTLNIGVVQPPRLLTRCGRIRRRCRAGYLLCQHLLLDHDDLRSVSEAQRSRSSPPRRLQRSGYGRLQQPAHSRHGSGDGHGPQGLRRLREPGMGLRRTTSKGTAVDDQAEGQYWVVNGLHFNNGCCFDYGNAEIDSRDDDNGTMETTYFGNSTAWYHGIAPGPWIMTDQENNLVGCVNSDGSKTCAKLPTITWRFVTAIAKGEPHHWTSMGGDAQRGALSVMFDGPRIDATYDPMRKQGAILLGNGGDNSDSSQGTFYEGAMTAAGTFPTDASDQMVQANMVAAHMMCRG